MDRRLAGAALIATPLLALIFRGLGVSGLRPLTACLVALAIYWGLLALALRFSGGWSLRPRWPGRAVGLVLVSCVTGMAAVGAGALAGLSAHVLAVVVLAGLINGHLEEAFWRGALVPDLGPDLGPDPAAGDALRAVPAVLLFGLWHFAPAAAPLTLPGGAVAMVLCATALGAILMAARLFSGTAGAGAIAHALINIFAFAMLASTNAKAV